MTKRFNGKVVVVTSGTRGIGLAREMQPLAGREGVSV